MIKGSPGQKESKKPGSGSNFRRLPDQQRATLGPTDRLSWSTSSGVFLLGVSAERGSAGVGRADRGQGPAQGLENMEFRCHSSGRRPDVSSVLFEDHSLQRNKLGTSDRSCSDHLSTGHHLPSRGCPQGGLAACPPHTPLPTSPRSGGEAGPASCYLGSPWRLPRHPVSHRPSF